MAATDILLLWSGANSTNRHASKGGQVSLAPLPKYPRFTSRIGEAVVTSGTYPLSGVELVAMDECRGGLPWDAMPAEALRRIIISVHLVDAVNNKVAFNITLQGRAGWLTSFGTRYVYFTAGTFDDTHTVKVLRQFDDAVLEMRVTPSELVLGQACDVQVPVAPVEDPVSLVGHTGRYVSPQVPNPRSKYVTYRWYSGIVDVVYCAGAATGYATYEYSQRSFSISVSSYTATTATITMQRGVSIHHVVDLGVGVVYVTLRIPDTPVHVVVRVDTDELVAAKWSLGSGDYVQDASQLGTEEYFMDDLTTDSIVPNLLANGSKEYLGVYIKNAREASPVGVSMTRSGTLSNMYVHVIQDLDSGSYWVFGDGVTQKLSEAPSDSGGSQTVSNINLLDFGTIPVGQYVGFWLRFFCDAQLPQQLSLDLIWVPT